MTKIAIDDDELDPNSVTLYVKKHKVTVKNGIIIYIHHEQCKKPCPQTKSIVEYLVDEAFTTAGSIILAETYGNGESK